MVPAHRPFVPSISTLAIVCTTAFASALEGISQIEWGTDIRYWLRQSDQAIALAVFELQTNANGPDVVWP
ncbi:hypothetical protein [Methylocystis sp. B8]|uniref:hypothetical protein n=1 Tax=Methylocystis sp. B8 TaxID=544938 RepID=UPI0014856C0A|nr:hypothetical protein [Methylocystis sp. B8]